MIFNTIQPKGYFIDYTVNVSSTVDKLHLFCGRHKIKGAYCPNCHKPLLRYFTMDLSDKNITFVKPPYAKLSLLFCWTCNIAQELFYYRVINDCTISIIKYGKGGVEIDFPYPNYPIHFPRRYAILKEVSDDIQYVLSMLNAGRINEYDVMKKKPSLCKPRHQIGGEPYLIQPELYMVNCPLCKNRMPFLASFGDDCFDPRGFTGNEYTQVLFFYCISCSVIGVFQRCD